MLLMDRFRYEMASAVTPPHMSLMKPHCASLTTAQQCALLMEAIDVHQQHGASKGYVWDSDDAVNLRRKHRVLGSYLGCVANFKSQNAVSGLPLELSVDEVAFSVSKGWARVLPPVLQTDSSWLVQQQQGSAPDASTYSAAGRTRRLQDKQAYATWLEDYYKFYVSQGAYGPEVSQAAGQQGTSSEPYPPNGTGGPRSGQRGGGAPYRPNLNNAYWLRQYYDFYYPDSDTVQTVVDRPVRTSIAPGAADQGRATTGAEPQGGGGRSQAQAGQAARQLMGSSLPAPAPTVKSEVSTSAAGCPPPPAWKAALQDGATFVVPLKAAAAAASGAASAGTAGTGKAAGEQQPSAGGEGSTTAAQPTGVPLRASELQHIRQHVFQDLHSQGYAMSAGPKFGSDLLAYPGDPSLFHAQFTVRFMQPDEPINPLALKGAARGSHSARKHLLLASVVPGTAQPLYISIAPEAGFGKAS